VLALSTLFVGYTFLLTIGKTLAIIAMVSGEPFSAAFASFKIQSGKAKRNDVTIIVYYF